MSVSNPTDLVDRANQNQFLDSVLSSIGTGSSTPVPAKPKPLPSKQLYTPSIVPIKRKAEAGSDEPASKINKVNRTTTTESEHQSRGNASLLPKQRNNTSLTVPITQAAPASSNKVPKKGSFAAIMARAKETQAAPVSSIGSIMHKPKEKGRSRKELMMERELAKKAAKKGVSLKSLQFGKNNLVREAVKKPGQNQRPSTATKSGYQGTTKPSAKSTSQRLDAPSSSSTYNGTTKSAYSGTAAKAPARNANSNRTGQSIKKNRSDYDEPDGYGSNELLDYSSEDYSDMDAGFDDMEDEDEEATRIARKEDAAAQAELDRLKREKDRKKSLLLKGQR